jgi:Mg2+/Co2+ transporter CorB
MTTFTTEDRIIAEKDGSFTINVEGGTVKMNEPVAWMLADKKAEHIRSIMAVQHDFVPEGCVEIPLYTHPVKELTDEEIRKIALECDAYDNDGGLITDDICIDKFARAILRKAQEK